MTHLTEKERCYVMAEAEKFSLYLTSKKVTKPEVRERLRKCYLDSLHRVTSLRYPKAQDPYTQYIGQMGYVYGNAYHGFKIRFQEGKTLDTLHFNFKKIHPEQLMSKTTLFTIYPNNGKNIDFFETSLLTLDQKLNALKDYLDDQYSVSEMANCKIWMSESMVKLSVEMSISEITDE